MRGHWDSLRTAIHTHRHSNSKSCDTGNCLPYMLSIIDCTYVHSLEEWALRTSCPHSMSVPGIAITKHHINAHTHTHTHTHTHPSLFFSYIAKCRVHHKMNILPLCLIIILTCINIIILSHERLKGLWTLQP